MFCAIGYVEVSLTSIARRTGFIAVPYTGYIISFILSPSLSLFEYISPRIVPKVIAIITKQTVPTNTNVCLELAHPHHFLSGSSLAVSWVFMSGILS